MDEMTQALEDLLVCQSLDTEDRDCVEQALDDGYATLDATEKSRIRRLLNQRAAYPSGSSALQRYRMRRQARSGRTVVRQFTAAPAAVH